MDNEYKKLYDSLIVDKMNSVIIRYSPERHNFVYQGYHHKAETNALKDVTNLVIDDIVFYAFSEKEIVARHNEIGLLDDLRSAAKYAYANRLPQRENADSDGLLGEVLLDLFIQTYSSEAKKLVVRAKHTEIGSKKEITGYDALYFIKDSQEVFLWLGQAKAGTKSYCKTDIGKDLLSKYKKEYFAKTAFYLADRKDTEELDELLKCVNKVCLDSIIHKWTDDEKIKELFKVLRENNVKIKIPCLVTYTKDMYKDKGLLKQKLEQEISEFINHFDLKKFNIEIDLEWEVLFWIFPIEDVNFVRNELVKLKKEVV